MKFPRAAVGFVFARRALFAALFAAVCAVALLCLRRADFAENIYDLLPSDNEIVKAHIWAGHNFKRENSLFFSVSNNSENASALAGEFAAALAKLGVFESVVCDVSENASAAEASDFLPYIFDSAAEKKLREIVRAEKISARFSILKNALVRGDYSAKFALKYDPLGAMSAFSDKFARAFSFGGAAVRDFKITTSDGSEILVVAQGNFDCADSAASTALVEKIDTLIAEFRAAHPNFSVAYAGGYRVSACNAAIARRDSQHCLLATLAAMLVICFAAFRNRILALAALAPSLLGSAFAFVACCAAFSTMSSISIAFAGIAVGVSIDYAIHVLYFADSRRGVFDLCAAQNCASRLALPVFIAAGTTCAAFAIMAFGGGSGFLQLGVFGVLGVVAAAVISVLVLPAFLAGFRGRSGAERTIPERLAEHARAFANSKRAYFAAAAATVAAAFFAGNVRFSGDMSAFNILDSAAKADDSLMREKWAAALSSKSVLLRADSFDSLLDETEKLRAFLASRGGISASGAWTLLAPRSVQSENARRWNAFWGDPHVGSEIARGCKIAGVPLSRVENSVRAAPETPPDLRTFKASAASKLFASCAIFDAPNFALLARFSADGNFDAPAFAAALKNSVSGAELIDPAYLGQTIADIAFVWLRKFAVLSFALAAAYLFFALGRSFAAVAAVLTPVVLGLFWSFGVLGATGTDINLVNSMFVVFAVCLAQDYSLFVFVCLRDGGDLRRTFAAIFVSAATTAAAFGVLATASHPVVNGLGAVSAVSILSILAACVCLSAKLSKIVVDRK